MTHRRSGYSFGTILALLITAICATPDATAFSLGKIRVTGAFESQFKAEIPVRTDGKTDLVVSLAPKEEYKKLGVTWSDVIDGLRVRVGKHPTAPKQMIIYIISDRPIFKPSFNLLVKARLGGGVILENFFLAVDFQKNLSLDIDPAEKEEMDRIASAMDAMKKGTRLDEKEDQRMKGEDRLLLEKIRAEEESAEQVSVTPQEKNDSIVVKKIEPEEPATVATPNPVKAPPAPAKVEKKETIIVVKAIEPEPATKEEVAEAAAAEPVVTPKTPEPVEQASDEKIYLPMGADIKTAIHKVEEGASLYRIVKEGGVGKVDYDQVVVAIWMNNKSKFIKGNMHGLRASSVLNLTKVNETAATLSKAEAKRIIARQWGDWKRRDVMRVAKKGIPATGDTVAATGKVATGVIPFRNSVLSALSRWSEQSSIDLDLDNVTIEKSGDGSVQATAQTEQGGSKEDMSLSLKPSGDGSYEVVTILAGEEKKPEPTPEPEKVEPESKSYVVHVASFKRGNHARNMVRLLKLKGYNAFEVLTFVPGKGDWYRVVIDRYSDREGAGEFASSVRRSGTLNYTRILKLPYAVLVEERMDRETADRLSHRLSEEGFSPYTVRANPEGEVNVLVGAFASKEVAEKVRADIHSRGFQCETVQP